MKSLVIAAIPDENDRVWKVSSEKVPHLTILYLGDDADKVANIDKIVEFVEHAATMTLQRFYLPVDRRGELGDDPDLGPADVLFFKKGRYDYKAIRDFRATLLQNSAIKTAYDAAPQFDGPWLPHLTLGYEKRPANPIPDDQIGTFYDVQFNKIVVWTGDYEGPEFLLKDYWDEMDMLDAMPMDMAMSSINEARVAAGLEVLEHFGVKGMRWGVRKAKDARFRTSRNSLATVTSLVDGAVNLTKTHDLPEINKKYSAKGAKTSSTVHLHSLSSVPVQKAYRNEVREAYRKRLEETANSMTNASGTRKYEISDTRFGPSGSPTRWKVKTTAIRHAIEDELDTDFEVEPIYDEDGFITDIRLVEDSLAQTAIERGKEFVAHATKVSDTKWSEFKDSDYTDEQYARACLLDRGKDVESVKERYGLPVREPDGTLNRNACHAAAAVLSSKGGTGSARGNKIKATPEQLTAAKKKLVSLYEGPLDEDVPEGLAMGEMMSKDKMVHQVDLGTEFMEHFGVKGMRWGVRKAVEKVKSGARRVGKALSDFGASLADSNWQSSTYNDYKHEAVHNHVAKELDNHIERLQRSPKYRGKDLKADSDLRKEYYQDVAKVTSSAYRRAVKETYGENYTGTKTAHYVTDARGPRIEVRNKKSGETESEAPLTSMREIKKRREAETAGLAQTAIVSHAVDDFPDLVIELTLDDNGQISGVGFVQPSEPPDSMKQTMDLGAAFLAHAGLEITTDEMTDEFLLEHFGIRGMRWGVRKPPPEAVAPIATSHVPQGSRRKTKIKTEGGENHPAHEDAIQVAEAKAKLKRSGVSALSNKELRDVRERVQLEEQVQGLMTSRGKKFVRRNLELEGERQFNRGLKKGVNRGLPIVGRAAANTKAARTVGRTAATVATTAALL